MGTARWISCGTSSGGTVIAWRMNGMSLIRAVCFFGIVGGCAGPPGHARDWTLALLPYGDGSAALIWQDTSTNYWSTGVLAYWPISSFTVWDNFPLLPSSRLIDTAWRIKAAGDFNRDGRPDLVWQHETDGRIAIWFMKGNVQISGVPLGPGQVADTDWKIVGGGDFNGDGWRDLVWQHQADGRIAVWKMMQGTVLVEGDVIGQVADLNWKIGAVGDINGDNRTDLIWHHRVSGHVAVWLMDGTTVTSGEVIGYADSTWHLVGPR